MTSTCLSWAALVTLTTLAMPTNAAENPKFCNVLLHNQGDTSIVGLHRFVDAARERGLLPPMELTVLLNGHEERLMPGERAFFVELFDGGHEIAVELPAYRATTARWLGIDEAAITTQGAGLFADAQVEQQAEITAAGFTAALNVCVEGNSLAEFWDIPHNWEGAPMFPYWAQWDAENPLRTDRTNRELDKDRAVLELHWASRTLWHNYDRFPIPQCFHFGEPLKHSQWSVGQLVRPGEGGGWWRVEVDQYERNLHAGRTPFLYLNTASEANIFTPGGPWKPFLDSDEALECALDFVELLLERGWNLCTVSEFTQWFTERWPCPEAPSMVYVMDDTLANRRDRDGRIIPGHGRLLHAETKYFQITDHENRIAPEMVVAYALRTPNLLRGGYAWADPARWDAPESRDGHYGSTTGNAIFWSPGEPLADIHGTPYFPPHKKPECRERTFTLHIGDAWEPFQFVPGTIHGVEREGDTIRWSKTMDAPAPGTDTRLTYHHVLNGPKHRVRVEVAGRDAVGEAVSLRLAPFFHQGWDQKPPADMSAANVPDPNRAGQERNTFVRVGNEEFGYREDNQSLRKHTFETGSSGEVTLYNRNPGAVGGTCDDNPAFNRGFTVTLGRPGTVVAMDQAGPNNHSLLEIHFGAHAPGQAYEFALEYWRGAPEPVDREQPRGHAGVGQAKDRP